MYEHRQFIANKKVSTSFLLQTLATTSNDDNVFHNERGVLLRAPVLSGRTVHTGMNGIYVLMFSLVYIFGIITCVLVVALLFVCRQEVNHHAKYYADCTSVVHRVCVILKLT